MSSFVNQLFLVAFFAFLAFPAHLVDAREGRFFFSKTTRTGVEPNKATTVPEATSNGVVEEPRGTTLPQPSNNRGYGLYGRPEEYYTPTYFSGGVHRKVDKLSATNIPTTTELAAKEGDRNEYNNGNGEPFVDNGSGRGRPYEGNRPYGMSDTRVYQNGRYYYDVNTEKYGYGYESNPMRTGPEEFGSGYGGARRGRYGYGNGDEFNNGMEYQNQNQEEYIP